MADSENISPKDPDLVAHSALVALTLSAVSRLQVAFFEAPGSADMQKAMLQAAGDMLDRTLPDKPVKDILAKVERDQHVATLVAHRTQLSAIPPRFWRAPRVRPNELGMAHYSGFRAVDRLLRRELDTDGKAWAAAQKWLEPAWQTYPSLAQEAKALWAAGGPAVT